MMMMILFAIYIYNNHNHKLSIKHWTMAHYHFRWSQTSRTFQHFKCFFPSWITWEFCYVIYVDCWIRWRSIFFFIINILISLNRKKGQRSWSFEYDFHQDCFHYVVMIVLKIFYSIWWEHFFFFIAHTGKHVPGGLQSIEHVFCPFNGRFRFSYIGNNGGSSTSQQQQMRCDFGYSEMSNCPHGNALNVKFRKCSFQTMGRSISVEFINEQLIQSWSNQLSHPQLIISFVDIHFLCLGDWPTTTTTNSNERYLALMDLREAPEANRPKYRCGVCKCLCVTSWSD